MTTQPDAPLDLDAIQARHTAATGGDWRYEAYAGLGEHGVLGAANIPIGRLDFGDGTQADADRDFVLNAHRDISTLRARVRELEDRLDERTADVAERALENTRLRDVLKSTQEIAALDSVTCESCGHLESAHDPDGDRDCNASGARVRDCTCEHFIGLHVEPAA